MHSSSASKHYISPWASETWFYSNSKIYKTNFATKAFLNLEATLLHVPAQFKSYELLTVQRLQLLFPVNQNIVQCSTKMYNILQIKNEY